MNNTLKIYTRQELALRDGNKNLEIWIAYRGKIYDVSHSRLFQGGKHFRHSGGRDLTAELANAPHTDRVFENIPVIGLLKDLDE
jgi:predicted heme/steroid binding protein